MHVIVDSDAPNPSRQYKILGHCHDRDPIVNAYGIHWKFLNVPKLSLVDECNMNYDRHTQTFIAAVKRECPCITHQQGLRILDWL